MKRLVFLLFLFAGMLCFTSVHADKHGGEMASADMLTNTCIACHGPGGVSHGPAIPSLAGMTENYFVGAMLAYKYHDDPTGLVKAMEELGKDKMYEDAEALSRYSTIMGRIAKGYTLEEIKIMAAVFADSEHVPAMQGFDKSRVASGENLHEEYCDKCHEDGGISPEDDVGILAGQWMPYLHYTLHDYLDGNRDMPKKMKKALKEVHESKGKDGILDLLNYYASVK